MDIYEAFGDLQSKVNELVQKYNEVVTKHNALASQVIEAVQRNQAGRASVNDSAREVIAEAYRRAGAYTNLVMLAGYAGFFALFHAFRKGMSHTVALCIGLLLAISLFTFAVGEVLKMVDQALFSRKLSRLVEEGLEVPTRLRAYQEAGRHMDQRQAKWWPWLLGLTLLTGVPAGLILIGYFAFRLVGA